MTIKALLLLACWLTGANADSPSVRRREQEDADADGGRIVGGTPAASGQYPWFVLFDSGACGGTLIRNDRVLTTATCVLNQPPTTVRVGASNANDGVEAIVKCANIHPDYYRTGNSIANDVAVIKLQEPVEGVDIVLLNTDISYPEATEQTVTTMGFGFTSNNGPISDTLQVAPLTFLNTFDCQENFPQMTISSSQHICAQDGSIGVCTGDSGGPLMDGTGSDATQIGITSFTFGGCASEVYPDVFTKVATYWGWIASEIRGEFCTGEVASVSPSVSPTSAPTVPTPSPTPAPTKEPCLFDVVTDIIGDLLPGNGGHHAADGEDVPEGELSEEAEEEKKGGFGIWNFIDGLVSGGQKDEQEDKKGGKDDKGKNKREQEEETNGIVVGPAKESGGN